MVISSVVFGHCGLNNKNMLDDYGMDLDIFKWEQFYDFGASIMFTTTDKYMYHVKAFYHNHYQRPAELKQQKDTFPCLCVWGDALSNPVIQWILFTSSIKYIILFTCMSNM